MRSSSRLRWCMCLDLHAHAPANDLILSVPVRLQSTWLLGSEHISVDMAQAPISGAVCLLPQVEATTAVHMLLKDAASGQYMGGVRALAT
jgi:hypothetical protein